MTDLKQYENESMPEPQSASIDTSRVDPERRGFLTKTAAVVGGVGVIGMVVPFAATLAPSARARAAGAPVDIDISQLEPGQKVTVEWRGKPVWIVRRTQESLDALPGLRNTLADPESVISIQPDYVDKDNRAQRPEYMVMVGVCTHLGCSPTFRPELFVSEDDGKWQAGFFCPCHGSIFDIAGRVQKGVPAPTNLEVPPHRYVNDSVIRIGEDPEVA